ncbi:hypothetical protein ABZP36_019114 [Zizania latifolia]
MICSWAPPPSSRRFNPHLHVLLHPDSSHLVAGYKKTHAYTASRCINRGSPPPSSSSMDDPPLLFLILAAGE